MSCATFKQKFKYRQERYWISNSCMLFWDEFVDVVVLLHKDETVGSDHLLSQIQ